MPNFTTNYNLGKPLVNDPTDEDLWGGYLNTNMDTLDTTIKSVSDSVAALITVPIGAVLIWATNTAPTNYLLCDGAAVSRTTYASLFALIGTTYGVGDGSTTFNLPNVKGKLVVGRDAAQTEYDTLAETGGSKTYDISHSHTLPTVSSGASWAATFQNDSTANGALLRTSFSGATINTGGSATQSVLNPYIVLNYIIRAT